MIGLDSKGVPAAGQRLRKGLQHEISDEKLRRVFFAPEGTPYYQTTLPGTVWCKGDVDIPIIVEEHV